MYAPEQFYATTDGRDVLLKENHLLFSAYLNLYLYITILGCYPATGIPSGILYAMQDAACDLHNPTVYGLRLGYLKEQLPTMLLFTH